MKSNVSESVSTEASYVQGVSASSGGLLKATLGAAVVAGAILTCVWLPAEYGIDPTGVGRALGLTDMGEIKKQLVTESEADLAAAKVVNTDVDLSMLEINQKLAAIQTQLTAIAATIAIKESGDEQVVPMLSENSVVAPVSDVTPSLWRDEGDYILLPGEGIEVKLVMNKGELAEFEWNANGKVVNHDTHGDGSGQSISYEKGRAVPENAGELKAAFTGNHGWYWQNRTADPVVITLRTRGAYSKVLQP
ncbi:transmembrane anchor protein [Leucothrix arctica]|uniref:transmembrane anchor protein n=1 Tax=Leucothrix arctica TaxID=1481894 RepID=UPI001FE6F27F|nr:transmembrane anchor protein [Leucothrix arctica]